MFASLRKLKQLYGPYFGLTGKPLRHTWALLGLAGVNVCLAFVIAMINSTFNSLIGVMSLPGVTYTAFFMSALQFIGVIVIYAIIATLGFTLAQWLGQSIGKQKRKDLWQRWLTGKRAFLSKFTQTDPPLNPAQVIGQDSLRTIESSVSLISSFFTTLSNAVLGVVGLWLLSSTLTLVIFGQVWLIPGYMAIAALLYSLGYNRIMSLFGKKVKKNESELTQLNGEITEQLYHVDTFSEQVAIRQGDKFEQNCLEDLDTKQSKKSRAQFVLTTGLDFLRNIHQQLGFAMGLLLSAPQIIAKKLSIGQIFQVSQYFSYVVGLFTWHHEYYEQVTEIEVGIERLSAFEEILTKCDRLNKEKAEAIKIAYSPEGKEIVFSDLRVKTPTQQNCTTLADIHIPRGSRIKITGDSGAGKTTLLRMLGGIWPFGQGNISFPAKEDEVLFLSQAAYFPKRSTLWEAILYPQLDSADFSAKKSQVKQWMRQLEIEPKHINDLDIKKSWGDTLSGGEKQRVLLLSLLIHQPKPKVVVIDEGLSALNDRLLETALNMLAENLPETTFLCVDHNVAQRAFYTHELALTTPEGQPKLIPISAPGLKLAA